MENNILKISVGEKLPDSISFNGISPLIISKNLKEFALTIAIPNVTREILKEYKKGEIRVKYYTPCGEDIFVLLIKFGKNPWIATYFDVGEFGTGEYNKKDLKYKSLAERSKLVVMFLDPTTNIIKALRAENIMGFTLSDLKFLTLLMINKQTELGGVEVFKQRANKVLETFGLEGLLKDAGLNNDSVVGSETLS